MTSKKLGDILIEKGKITPEQLDISLSEQSSTGKRLGEILVEKSFLSEEELADHVSQRLSIPKVSLSSMVIDPAVIKRIPVGLARRFTLIPIFALGKTLTLAMADPLNIIAIDEIKYLTRAEVKRAIATRTEIVDAIDHYYSVADSLDQMISTREHEPLPAVETNASENESDNPITQLVNLIISKAVKDRASDIHIEPGEDRLRIRYRISNVMREEAAPPKSLQGELISRIKIAANLDVSEKRLPQDGRILTVVDGATVDLRVSTLPTIHGEKIVIRVLDRRNLLLSFEQLGFTAKIEEGWRQLINKPEGLILISGPTSSGKTSTLYTTLGEINSIEKNIITVEDPVEYSLPIINQIQINEKAGLNFPSTLRSMLRQNPDIIMIGEIRDTETAHMAVRSALTGHLVFSTIHTNDAPSAISRLLDMGIEPYLVASALNGILAQRLVRTNCKECLEEYTPLEGILQRAGMVDLVDSITFRRGAGCNACKNTGFSGMIGIYEFVRITPYLAEMIIERSSLNKIREQARKSGYVPLFEIGLEKVINGSVRLEELLKETSSAEDYFDPNEKFEVTDANARTVQI